MWIFRIESNWFRFVCANGWIESSQQASREHHAECNSENSSDPGQCKHGCALPLFWEIAEQKLRRGMLVTAFLNSKRYIHCRSARFRTAKKGSRPAQELLLRPFGANRPTMAKCPRTFKSQFVSQNHFQTRAV